MNRLMAEAQQAYAQAERLYSQAQVEQALDDMAEAMSARLHDSNPLLLAVMHGGLMTLGQLLPRLNFLLRQDYLHATRYRERLRGDDLQWRQQPQTDLSGETLVIVDDILDEGYTLEGIVQYCKKSGAKEVLSAVLVEKEHDRGADFQADFVGLKVPDRYVFGYGMDYKGYWRNAPGIFALREESA